MELRLSVIKARVEPGLPKKAVTLASMMAEQWGYTFDDLRASKRTRDLVTVRARVALSLREELRMTVADIGRLLNRDHTTVLNLLNGQPAERVRRSEGR